MSGLLTVVCIVTKVGLLQTVCHLVDLSELLGVELPIIQAPMAGVQGSAMAIAVAQAGGLGSLPCAMLGTEAIESEIALIRSASARPYNLNFFCHSPPRNDPQQEMRWQRVLAPYFTELGLNTDSAVNSPQRAPFTSAIADFLAPIKPPVISFHFGLPAPELVARVKSWGTRILGCATTVEEALWLEQRGVDAIIAQGTEAGGHRGQFLSHDLSQHRSTTQLLADMLGATTLPIVAAGGIAHAEQVAQMLQRACCGRTDRHCLPVVH